MSRFSPIGFLLIATVALSLLPAAALAEVQWQRMDTDHFAIFFPAEEGPGAMVFAKRAEKIREHVVEELGLDFKVKVTVYLAPDRETYNELQPRGHVPEWSIGTALVSRNTIIMFSPRGVTRESVRSDTAEVFAHELAHVTLHILARGQRLPRWLQEGVAQLVARQWRTRDTLNLTWAVLLGRLIPLSNLGNNWPKSGGRARLAYTESLSFIIYLRQNLYLTPVLIKLRNGMPLHDALVEVTERNLLELEAAWRSNLRRRQTWILLFDEGFLWFAMALLLIVGYVVVKFRRRKQYQRLGDGVRVRRSRADAEAELDDLLDEDNYRWH